MGIVETSYDALNRPLQVTDANGGYTSCVYNLNDVPVTTPHQWT